MPGASPGLPYARGGGAPPQGGTYTPAEQWSAPPAPPAGRAGGGTGGISPTAQIGTAVVVLLAGIAALARGLQSEVAAIGTGILTGRDAALAAEGQALEHLQGTLGEMHGAVGTIGPASRHLLRAAIAARMAPRSAEKSDTNVVAPGPKGAP